MQEIGKTRHVYADLLQQGVYLGTGFESPILAKKKGEEELEEEKDDDGQDWHEERVKRLMNSMD